VHFQSNQHVKKVEWLEVRDCGSFFCARKFSNLVVMFSNLVVMFSNLVVMFSNLVGFLHLVMFDCLIFEKSDNYKLVLCYKFQKLHSSGV
jgi:hypothetical protein